MGTLILVGIKVTSCVSYICNKGSVKAPAFLTYALNVSNDINNLKFFGTNSHKFHSSKDRDYLSKKTVLML